VDSPVRNDVPIEYLPYRLDVTRALQRLYDGGRYWNRHRLRTEQYVHSSVDDIWLRFHEWRDDITLAEFNEPHESVWYPIADEIPELKALALATWAKAMNLYGCVLELGGVLITKIPPGGEVIAHADRGWHAEHYNIKHALQLLGCTGQSFNFDGYAVSAHPGELYEFDNSQVHWVENKSPIDRITMIVCMRMNSDG
jgi:hypothetical protein